MGHLAEYAAETPKTRKRLNHIGETYNDEEESEPEEIRQITQINRMLPDKMTTTKSRK